MSQQGSIYKKNGAWFGKWRQDEVRNGQVVRVQRHRKLAEISDRYRTKKDVEPLLAEIVAPLNSGKAKPESTQTVADYYEGFFLPYIEANLKPSTKHGYKHLWRMYLGPRLQKAVLRDFRCVDATNMLTDIHSQHGIGRKTLRHCKALLSSIFTHAKSQGVLDGQNPVTDALIPRKAAAPEPTHAATIEEVTAMLNVLTGQAKVAVSVMFFAGLRPGEARGLQWSDYNGETLSVRRSVWNKFTTDPKTEMSVAEVPIPEVLQSILEEHRLAVNGSPYILANGGGRPLDLQNLANRVVRPALRAAGIPWYGYYALRRGTATFAEQFGAQAVMGALRHKNISTARHYVKPVAAETLKVARKFDDVFSVASQMVQ